MHCRLFVPDFFRLVAGSNERLPATETLIAKGRRRVGALESADAWLFEQFGVTRQRDWPVAPYSLAGDGGAPGEHYWLRADPAHLLVDRDRLVLAGAPAVSRAEAESLVETLNAHFGGEFVIYPMQPGRWYARLDAAPELQTVPPSQARGASVEPNLPAGADARRFRVLMNEAQMLLHEHPVNAAREARGEAPVNSVWLWGGGAIARAERPSLREVLADDPLARGLARAAGVAAAPLPADAASWLAHGPEDGIVLAVLEGRTPVELERDWFAPLRDALRAARVGMVSVHLPGAGAVLESETVRADLRHFWRLRRPASEYAPEAESS